jgi:hypothetical protein
VERIRWATAVFCVLLLIQIIRSVRREHIRVEYSMAWFAAVLGLLLLTLWDEGLRSMGSWLGVADSVVLALIAGLLFLFTFFRFSVEMSDLKDRDIVVTQKVGMLEWEIERQTREIEELRSKLEERREAEDSG